MSYTRNLAGAMAVALTFAATTASAISVDLVSVTGKWTSADPAAAVSGIGTNSIWWGTSTGYGKSGYSFVGVAPPAQTNIAPDLDFDLGTFTHYNKPVTGTTLTSAVLSVEIGISIGGGATQYVTSVFDFAHRETPNNANPCEFGGANGTGVNYYGCADKVTATTNLGSTEAFVVGDKTYTFMFSAFVYGGNVLDYFLTKEKKSNSAKLLAHYTISDNAPPVPLPAAGWLLLAAFGGLGLTRGRT